MESNLSPVAVPVSPASIKQVGDHNLVLNNENGGMVKLYQQYKTTDYNEKGIPYTPINHVRFDSEKRIIYLNNEAVAIPGELIQPELFTSEELPYVKALFDVYAEKLGKTPIEIFPGNVNALPNNMQRHYSSQRKSYYRAEYVRHVARETFADGNQQFCALTEDAYAGIEDTYYDEDYLNGFDRLKAILEKITTISLAKSSLMNINGLVGNTERKGICHILVNDEKIKSWVNINA